MRNARYRRRCAIFTYVLAASSLIFIAEAELEQTDVEWEFSKRLMQKGASLRDLALEDEETDKPGILVFAPLAVPESLTSIRNHISNSSSSSRGPNANGSGRRSR